MEYLSQAMAAEVADNGEPLCLDIGLDRISDIANCSPRFDYIDSLPKSLKSNIDESLGQTFYISHIVHSTGVAMPSIEDDGYVDINDIAVAKTFRARNAMTDDVVD